MNSEHSKPITSQCSSTPQKSTKSLATLATLLMRHRYIFPHFTVPRSLILPQPGRLSGLKEHPKALEDAREHP